MRRDRENQRQSERLERATPIWTRSADFHTGPRQVNGRITRPDTRKRLTTCLNPAKNPLRPTGRPHTKHNLAVRPIHHQDQERIEAHIFIAFLAYCLHVTLGGRRLKGLAPGLTPRSVLEKFAAVQMIDVHIPTADGRELQLTRYTEPEPELTLLLNRLKLDLPDQPPPRSLRPRPPPRSPCSADLRGVVNVFNTFQNSDLAQSADFG